MFFKKLGNVQKEREFDHAKSVFKDWKKDNAIILDKCLEHDFKYWKTPNFCKNPDEQENVMRVVK